MLISYTFNPRTSVRSRKAAVNSTFACPSYRGRVGFNYRVLHVVALCAFRGLLLASFLLKIYPSYDIYSSSPLILVAPHPLLSQQYSTSAAPVLRLVLQQHPYFIFSFYSPQVQGLLAYKLRRDTPLESPRSSYTFQCLAYLLLYWVILYYRCFLYSGYLYIYIQQQNYYFAFQYGAQYPFIGPYNSIQALVLQFLQGYQGAFSQCSIVQFYTLDLGTIQHYWPYYYYIQQLYTSKGQSLG